MKKQILFLTFFIAAIFAGTTTAFGQYITYLDGASVVGDVDCAGVTALTCVGGTIDELHPQAGQPYTYAVTTDALNTVHWFVVAITNPIIVDINDITSNIGTNIDDDGLGGDPYIASSDGDYNAPATTSHDVSITWKSFDGLTTQVLLVAYVEDGAGCTDNIEVYRILPVFNFTLDVNAIAASGAEEGVAGSSTADTCVSPIQNATYVPSGTPATVPGELIMDYGENYVFFTVTAANYTHSWQPTFLITYPDAQATEVVTADWAYPAQAILSGGTWTSITIDGSAPSGIVNHSGTDATASPATVGSDDGSGECIVVRVRIDHGDQPENAINNQTITMAVNGFMNDMVLGGYTTAALEDLHWEDHGDTDGVCDDIDGFDNDWVNYILTPRPQVISNTGTPALEFEIKDNNTDRLGNGS